MLKGIEDTEPHDGYDGVWFVGTVVATDAGAPDGQAERIKANVPGLFEGAAATLPWCRKGTNADMANGPGFGSCNVPPIGSLVYVMLDQGDPHHPVYVGLAQTTLTLLAVFLTNYPKRRGWVDPAGNSFIVDNTGGANTLTYTHASGAAIAIDNSGKVTVTSIGDTTVNSSAKVVINGASDITLTSSTKVAVVAPTITLN